jgi:predicted AAA+ superfamily ATPase
MLPLSFKEFLQFNHLPDFSLEEKFNQYLKYGSLPAVASLPQNDSTIYTFLFGIYNSVVVKDVIERSRKATEHIALNDSTIVSTS